MLVWGEMRLLLLLAVVLLVAILVNFSSFVNGDTDPSDGKPLLVYLSFSLFLCFLVCEVVSTSSSFLVLKEKFS